MRAQQKQVGGAMPCRGLLIQGIKIEMVNGSGHTLGKGSVPFKTEKMLLKTSLMPLCAAGAALFCQDAPYPQSLLFWPLKYL